MKYIGENAIKRLIALIKGDLNKKLDKNQGTTNSGKILGVNAGGEVALTDTEVATLVDVPNGIVKGDGSTLSVAVAGTDYMAPVSGGTTGQILKKTETGTEWADAKESFVITFSASGSGSDITYSCDKTYADILAAYNAGYPLVASIPVYRSGKWSGFWTNDFSYKATAELFSPARFEFSMVYEEDDPDNLDMTAVVARLYSNDEVSIVKLPLQKKLYVSGIVKGAYNGMGGYNYSAAVAGTDYMAPVSGGTTGQVLTKTTNGQEWQSINKNNIGLGNVDNVKQYSVDNPPPYPVTSVNGATGEVKGTFYVTVTQGDNYNITADKTATEVYDAHAAGYAVYAITKFPGMNVPFVLPLVVGVDTGDIILLGFSALGSLSPDSAPNCPVVAYDGTTGKWAAWIGTLAGQGDIPTELANPNPLNIKIGDTTTRYDGSMTKTVVIPKGVPSVTTADNGKFLCVVNGAWAAVAYPNAEDSTF